jgi:hypothetical protein
MVVLEKGVQMQTETIPKETTDHLAVREMSYGDRIKLINSPHGLEMLLNFYQVGAERVVCAIIRELMGCRSGSRAVEQNGRIPNGSR